MIRAMLTDDEWIPEEYRNRYGRVLKHWKVEVVVELTNPNHTVEVFKIFKDYVKLEYEWTLKWSHLGDYERAVAAMDFLKTFNMWKACEAHIINHDQYMHLVDMELIKPPVDYWKISPGEYGLVALQGYDSYTQTWEKISTAYGDFCRGWDAYKAVIKQRDLLIQKEKDHIEALKMHREFKKYGEFGTTLCFWCASCGRRGKIKIYPSSHYINDDKCPRCGATTGVDFWIPIPGERRRAA
jgi:hypothetical protein